MIREIVLGNKWKWLYVIWVGLLLGLFYVPAQAEPSSEMVVISELMYHPAEVGTEYPSFDDREDAEFIELHNFGGSAVDLSAWSFTDGVEYAFPAGSSIAAGGFVVLAQDAAKFEAVYGFVPAGEYSGKLSNGGETVALSDGLGALVDSVTYDDEGLWAITPDELGPSLELIALAASHDDPANWAASTATALHTAGATNSVQAAAVPPLVTGVTAETNVAAAQDISVSAAIEGATSATLLYKVDFGSENSLTMSSTNGLTFTASIPGQVASSLVRYRIEASGAGGTRTSPRADDTINWWGVTVADSSTSQLPILRWYVDPNDYNSAYNNPSSDTPCNGELCPAVIAYEGRVWDNVGFRAAGLTSRNGVKKNWRLDFPKGHLFDPPFLPDGLDEFSLDGGTPNYDQMREHLSWETLNDLGFPEIRTQHMRIEQNGAFYGLYLLREEQDGTWRKRKDLDEGALYKFEKWNGNQGWAGHWEKKTRKEEPNDDLAELRACLDLTGDPLAACLNELMDIPSVIQELASIALIRQIDQREFNFFLYHDIDGSGLWRILPDDVDRTWGIDGSAQLPNPTTSLEKVDRRCLGTDGPPANELCRAMLRVPAFETMYYRRVRTLVDEYLVAGLPENRIDNLVAAIGTEWALDEGVWNRTPYTLAQHRDFLVNDFLPAWRTHLQSGGYNGKIPTAQSAAPQIVISEIQPNGDAEFLELHNPSATEWVDLSGWTIDGFGEIPQGVIITPGEYLVVVSDEAAFRAAYPHIERVDVYVDGGLKASGETLTLQRRDGFVADEVNYSDSASGTWPALPDDGSRSLELSDPAADNADGANWVLSEVGGTPTHPAPVGDLGNVALGKVATQSSTGFGGVPSRAVDGNPDGVYNNGSVTHTNNEANAWWEVDLGLAYPITEIKLYNRTDCCSHRLSNYYLIVSDAPFASQQLNDTLNQPGVSSYHNPGQAAAVETVSVNRSGRYVRVQLAGSNPLSLAEVEVFAANQAPTINDPGEQTNTEGDSIALSMSASDPDGDPLTYSAIGLPSGLAINSSSGEITGTLPLSGTASYDVIVIASDGFVADSTDFTWHVHSACGPLLQEAEQGTLSGDFVIANDGPPSGGEYIHVPNGSGNRFNGPDAAHKAEYCVYVENAGTYRIKAGAYAESGRDNSFYVQVDGSPSNGYLWDVARNTTYNVDYVSNRNGDDPVEVTLSAGQHMLAFFLREDGTRLDQIELEYVEETPPPPPPTCDGLVAEGEAGVLTGDFVVGNDQNASGGQYIHVPDGSGNSFNSPNPAHMAHYCFDVATAGTYRLKGWLYAATGQEDSFFLQVNGMPVNGYLWDFKKNTSYQMDFLSDRNGADPVEIELAAGEHLVSVFLREDGARLDKLELEEVESTPPPTCSSQLLAEAETGSLTGDFVIGSDQAASGGQYIHVPEGAGNSFNSPNPSHQAQYCFTVATAGTYRLRGWAYADTGQDNSFFVQVDGIPANGYQWSFPRNSSYQPDYVSDQGGADPVEVSLTAGDHIVTLFLREDGARLDKLELEQVDNGQNAPALLARGLLGTLLVDNDDHIEDDENELNLADISLTLLDAETEGQKYQEQTHTNQIGQFHFDQMPVGDYLLRLDSSTRQPITQLVTVNAERMAEITLELPAAQQNNNQIYLPLLKR
ncbi:MAG: lamin tail domain-containing protein [Ardenticatenaceae bacterium]